MSLGRDAPLSRAVQRPSGGSRRASARRWAPPPLLESCVNAEGVFGHHSHQHEPVEPRHVRPPTLTEQERCNPSSGRPTAPER